MNRQINIVQSICIHHSRGLEIASATMRAMRRNSSLVTGPPAGTSEESVDCRNCSQSACILNLNIYIYNQLSRTKIMSRLPEFFHSQTRKVFPSQWYSQIWPKHISIFLPHEVFQSRDSEYCRWIISWLVSLPLVSPRHYRVQRVRSTGKVF